MKKKFFCFFYFVFSVGMSFAQTWSAGAGSDIYYSAGNVGIGLSTPTYQLDLYHTSSQSSGQNSAGNVLNIQTAATSGNNISFGAKAKMTNSSGDVALGISLVGSSEHNGAGNVVNMRGVQGSGWISGSGTVTNMTAFYASLSVTGAGSATNGYGLYINDFPSGVTNKWGVYVNDANAKNYFAGSLGIGTTNNNGYKLAVNGSAIFTEAKVKLYANWPDYVFDDNYSLLPLNELEKYIKINKHLPTIPSANSIKEAGGFELGDMSIRLLQKIEELTLYILELKKENDQIKQEIINLIKK